MAGKEVRAMTDVELKQKLQADYQELFNLRFRQATKQLDNTSRIRVVRKDIAVIKTVLRERQLGPSDDAA
jgi:large subunit ribosomal protein L29